MRNELEHLARIEKYLLNRMDANEKNNFQNELNNNPSLQQEVSEIRLLMESSSYPQWKKQVQNGYSSYRFRKNIKTGAIAVAVAVATFAAVWLWKSGKLSGTSEKSPSYLPALNENGKEQWANADTFLPSQFFQINPEKDTVVISKGGIVLAIPAGFAQNQDGSAASGNVEIVLKEALDPASIMMAGLSTRSGDKQLETGGMFYVDVMQGETHLKINGDKNIIAQVPANEIKPGMQLFTGERKKDGSIDWVNPVELEKELTTVPIDQLNFYPPKYLPALKELGLNYNSKSYCDSLYYSFVFRNRMGEDSAAVGGFGVDSVFRADEIYPDKELVLSNSGIWQAIDITAEDTTKTADNVYVITYASDSIAAPGWINHYLGIDPPKIKAIWNKKFQQSIIATHEFEERLKIIHEYGLNKALDLYITNLDKPLCKTDSMVAQRINMRDLTDYVRNKFYNFAARGDGRVRTNARLNAAMQRFYKRAQKEYRQAAELAEKKFKKQISSTARNMQDQRNKKTVNDIKRHISNAVEEIALNLKEAYRQLGYTPVPVRSYTAGIRTTGWKNIDRIVVEKTIERKTIDDIDPITGKRVVIKYSPFKVSVAEFEKYEKVYAYLIPSELSSFMTMYGKNGVYSEKLNGLMQHNFVCIGFANDQWFIYQKENIYPGDLGKISLIKTTARDMERELKKQNRLGKVQDMLNAVSDEYLLLKQEKRMKKFSVTLETQKKVADKTFWKWSERLNAVVSDVSE